MIINVEIHDHKCRNTWSYVNSNSKWITKTVSFLFSEYVSCYDEFIASNLSVEGTSSNNTLETAQFRKGKLVGYSSTVLIILVIILVIIVILALGTYISM